jgi:hypothetical protein
MKKLFITLVSIFALAGCSFSQNSPATANDKNAPEISFVTLTHDFGTIPFQGDGTYEFEFKNTGKEPLVLSEVHSSCGCTTPEWPREPIKKGQKARIKVKYNTNIIGPFAKSIYVTSNAKTARVELKIKGTVASNNTNS